MSLLLPKNLQTVIEDAYTAMIYHPQNALIPIYRQRIYRTFSSDETLTPRWVRGWLAYLTAQHVLPIWQQAGSQSDIPKRLLCIAGGILHGEVSEVTVESDIKTLQTKFQESMSAETRTSSEEATFAYEAINAALREVLGRDPFEDITIDEHLTDASLDEWASDTAKWAAAAYAGATWSSKSDPSKQRKFWTWWLTEAVPTAWSIELQLR